MLTHAHLSAASYGELGKLRGKVAELCRQLSEYGRRKGRGGGGGMPKQPCGVLKQPCERAPWHPLHSKVSMPKEPCERALCTAKRDLLLTHKHSRARGGAGAGGAGYQVLEEELEEAERRLLLAEHQVSPPPPPARSLPPSPPPPPSPPSPLLSLSLSRWRRRSGACSAEHRESTRYAKRAL